MPPSRFARYAWFAVAYNILVILWGAFVRASGSGAGCGSHWPLCNGEVIPLAPSIERVIEFTHRTMSGIALLVVLGLVIWAFRAYRAGNPVRASAVASGVLIITEALIGAGLVLFGWVAQDQSAARVISISLHLVNTFLLLGALSLTAWWASLRNGEPIVGNAAASAVWRLSSPHHARVPYRGVKPVLVLALLGVIVIGVTGAVTALGDTLFPTRSLAEGLQQDVSPTADLLIRLRVIHPIVAITVGTYILLLTFFMTTPQDRVTGFLMNALRTLVVVQLLAGALNVILLAPTWMQLAHLFFADAVWITLVLFTAQVSGIPQAFAARPADQVQVPHEQRAAM